MLAVAKAVGKTPAQVSLAWLLRDARVSAVIIGARTVDQVEDNLVVGDWELPDAEHQRLSDVVEFNLGYPAEWIAGTYPNTFDGVETPG